MGETVFEARVDFEMLVALDISGKLARLLFNSDPRATGRDFIVFSDVSFEIVRLIDANVLP